MMRFAPHFRLALVLLALAVFAVPSHGLAQDAPAPAPAEVLQDLSQKAATLEGRLDNGAVLDDAIEAERAAMEEYRKRLTEIAAAAEAEAAPLRAELQALGPAPEDGSVEAAEVTEQRERLTQQLAEIEAQVKRAQQEAARARALIDRLNDLRRQRFTEKLVERDESPLSPDRILGAWTSLSHKAAALWGSLRSHVLAQADRGELIDAFALPVALVILALILVRILRRWIVRRLRAAAGPEASHARCVTYGVLIMSARLLLMATSLALIAFGLSDGWFPSGQVTRFGWGLVGSAAILIGASALGRAFYAPGEPHLRISELTDARTVAADTRARFAYRALMALATVIALHHLLIETGEDIFLGLDALNVLNAAILVLGGLALWSFIHCAGIGAAPIADTPAPKAEDEPVEQPHDRSPMIVHSVRIFRVIALLVAFLSPMLALLGYYRASQFVFYPLVDSMALIGTCLLVYRIAKALSTPEGQTTAPAPGEAPAAILPVATGFVLIVAALPVLALIWGADTTDLLLAWTRIVEGFQIGDVTIAPVEFLTFAIVFAIGYMLTRTLQGIMRRSVLPLTKLDEGARSAAVAGIGYVGVVVAALIAISTTGLDLSNLAIVAGALSVGIGFGLQNVVNNFVSGIILLIERPIKTGDWVEIGGVHGTVRKVNVRSTEIQTFDRSTMFVPNADLISGTVTNWTHGNSLGRIIVPVGVSYGTDVRKVEKILLDIARAHPMLTRRPAPYVIFTGFGASSLDFEIRGVLRDVNWILNVGSDLRFSIYEKFLEEAIEIPFAQRDITIKNLDEVIQATRGSADAGAPAPKNRVPPGEGQDGD